MGAAEATMVPAPKWRLPSLVALELMQVGKGHFWSEWLGMAGFLGLL